MKYNNWKMMDKVGVAVCSKKPETWRGNEQFDGFIFEAEDKNARETAEGWARRYDNQYDNTKETIVYEPNVHIFDNEGFTVTILDSAGGSSQGGRLSFWKCKVEKDGVEFVVGVNDAILADLIRNSDMERGKVKQVLMFARKGGQPGFIHEGMEAYADATADMAHKAAMKSAKKTSKWDIGGVYSSVTLTDVCMGQVWDTMEEYTEQTNNSWYGRMETKLRKRDKPVKVYIWTHMSNYRHKDGIPKTFTDFMNEEIGDGSYIYFSRGKPPARAKTDQLEVKDSDLKLIDKMLDLYSDYRGYNEESVKGRYVRELK